MRVLILIAVIPSGAMAQAAEPALSATEDSCYLEHPCYNKAELPEDCEFTGIYIPNIVTPEDDGDVSEWGFTFYGGCEPCNFELKIYNPWGEVIFEADDPDNHWNCRGPDGELVIDGLYVWSVFYQVPGQDSSKHSGHFTVLK
jgi:hypothetical protein